MNFVKTLPDFDRYFLSSKDLPNCIILDFNKNRAQIMILHRIEEFI